MFLLLPLQAVAQQTAETARIVNAAESFLSTLDADQRKHVLYAFNDNEQRQRWSNFPTGVVPRGGISFKQMTAPQRDAAMKLLAVVLSPMGLEKVNEIRQADDDFKANGSKRGPGVEAVVREVRRLEAKMVHLLEEQRARRFWGTRPIGGDDLFGSESLLHLVPRYAFDHQSLDASVRRPPSRPEYHDLGKQRRTDADPHRSAASLLPAGWKNHPAAWKGERQGAGLLQSLDDKQRKQAVLGYEVADLVLGPGQDGKKIAPEGLKVSAMNEKQKAMVLDLIAEWAGILNDNSSAATMSEIKKDLNETWFAWSGPVTGEPGTNISAYYRIQGPHLVIEYAPQRDEPTNHVHTMYRDPTNDYGGALAKK